MIAASGVITHLVSVPIAQGYWRAKALARAAGTSSAVSPRSTDPQLLGGLTGIVISYLLVWAVARGLPRDVLDIRRGTDYSSCCPGRFSRRDASRTGGI